LNDQLQLNVSLTKKFQNKNQDYIKLIIYVSNSGFNLGNIESLKDFMRP